MSEHKTARRIEMQRLIKAYLLFNGEATSRELAVWLDRNFGYRHSLTTGGVRQMLRAGNCPAWLNVEYVDGYVGKWRLKK